MGAVHAKEPDMGEAAEPQPAAKTIALDQVPVRVERVHIDGLKRTKDDIASHQVRHVFEADNFTDLVKEVTWAKSCLQRLGCFRSVDVVIDVVKGSRDGYEVVFQVDESKRFSGGVNTLVGTNEGAVLFGARLPNLAGRGQKLQGEYQYGSNKNVGVSATYSQPLFFDPYVKFNCGVGQSSMQVPWSSFHQLDRGVFADVQFPSVLGEHEVKWHGIWRELSALNKLTSFPVRAQCGHSLKSSLTHTIVRDTRDQPMMPNSGYLLRLANEVAGLGGDVAFLKHTLDGQVNMQGPLGSVLQLGVSGGVMTSVPGVEGAESKPPRLCDHYFLGGPLTLRGFRMRGVGPHANEDALGGTLQWQGAARLYTPLPFRPSAGGFGDLFRLQLFLTAGNLQYSSTLDAVEWSRLARDLRWCYGFGVVLRLGKVARAELNYCFPQAAKVGDRITPGFQFGVGIDYL